LAHGVQFNASYTYSHSIDNNSRNAEGIVSQNSNNIGGERGSSDLTSGTASPSIPSMTCRSKAIG